MQHQGLCSLYSNTHASKIVQPKFIHGGSSNNLLVNYLVQHKLLASCLSRLKISLAITLAIELFAHDTI